MSWSVGGLGNRAGSLPTFPLPPGHVEPPPPICKCHNGFPAFLAGGLADNGDWGESLARHHIAPGNSAQLREGNYGHKCWLSYPCSRRPSSTGENRMQLDFETDTDYLVSSLMIFALFHEIY